MTQLLDKDGKPTTVQVPGIPLFATVEKVPDDIIVEYIKIDAQGYDLEVMKGALPATNKIQVVSLEAMDVTDKSQVLYIGQPTLEEVKQVLAANGWHYILSIYNQGAKGEVNAFFVSNMQYATKVPELSRILMSNKEKGDSGKI